MSRHRRFNKHTDDRKQLWLPIIGGAFHLLAVVIDKAWGLVTS